jgi:hypothetical protein
VAGAIGSAAVVAVPWNGGPAAEGLAAAAGETAGFYAFAGILVGKVIADIAFYSLAIVSYETLIRPRAKRET